MATSRTTFTLDNELADQARSLDINVSAAARQGVADAVRAAREWADREAYLRYPEDDEDVWTDVRAWGES
jgi:post-segregation antitoxin (ccd killing protein)